jgi:hypothetical protein
MASLYELENQYLKIQSLIESNDEELLNDTLDSIDFSSNFNEKVANYGKLILNIKSDTEAIKIEEERLKKRRKTMENKVANLEGRVLDGMNLVGTTRVNTPVLTISVRNNQRVTVTDESKVDHRFLVAQKPKISKSEIKKAIKNGETVDGAEITKYQSLNVK